MIQYLPLSHPLIFSLSPSHHALTLLCFVFLSGSEKGKCVASEYFTEPEVEITTENTANILSEYIDGEIWKFSCSVSDTHLIVFCAFTEMVRTATPFPMVSLLFVFTAFILSNVGHIRPQRTILAFVSGIFFILSGINHSFIHL